MVTSLIYNSRQDELSKRLFRLLKTFPLKNIFNPSFVDRDGYTIIAFRAINPATNKINSFVATFGETDQLIDLLNLNTYVEQFGVSTAADPKIFTEGNTNVWLTFNTGYSDDQNDVYLLKIYPKVEQPIRCVYQGRERIEKNWAFFFEDGKILALYSIAPFVVLEALWPSSDATVCEFRERLKDSENHRQPRLSIGTQLVATGSGYLFIAHRKLTFFNKRIYYGVPVFLLRNDQGYRIVVNKRMRLIHSFRSLLGSKLKHNKNLISCTYFSGINRIAENKYVVGYGINDVNFSFSLLNTI